MRWKLVLVALVLGLQYADHHPRMLFKPPGYPLSEEYDECSKPRTLDILLWLYCVELKNW